MPKLEIVEVDVPVDPNEDPCCSAINFFFWWLDCMESGDDTSAEEWRLKFDKAREIAVERSPSLDKPLWILNSAMALGNVSQARELWPEADYALMEHWAECLPDKSGVQDGQNIEADWDDAIQLLTSPQRMIAAEIRGNRFGRSDDDLTQHADADAEKPREAIAKQIGRINEAWRKSGVAFRVARAGRNPVRNKIVSSRTQLSS